jgi:hypothetical protein
MAIRVTGKFATPEDTAEILGVSPARTRRLVAMVDGILAEQGSAHPPKAAARPRTAGAKRRIHSAKSSAKSSRSMTKRAARSPKD